MEVHFIKVSIKKVTISMKQMYWCLMYLGEAVQWIQVIIAKSLVMTVDCL